MNAPLIALVGRPNVGKSTLFNRLVGGRNALVHDTPGLTRDRRYGEFDYFGHTFRVVDTGGLDPEAEMDVVTAGVHRQAELAMQEADFVLFVVDGTAGIVPIDRELATSVRKVGRPVLCAVNKIDGPKRDSLMSEFFALGMPLCGVSAAHGRGVDEMLEKTVELLELPAPTHQTGDDDDDEQADATDAQLRVGFFGKPNAGKSSLTNRLLGVERSLVHDQPGTTTDPVETAFQFAGRDYTLVDTAGLRRRARVHEDLEKLSAIIALGSVRRVDVGVLVIDAAIGPTDQDAKLAGQIEEQGRALVVAINKSDLLAPDGAAKIKSQLADELMFVAHAPTVLVSALRGDGVGKLMQAVDDAAAQHGRRISTAELNRFFADVCESHPPPLYRHRPVQIRYLSQVRTKPPTFVLWANRPDGIAPSYRRYVINQLRARYRFGGTPLRLIVKGKGAANQQRAVGRPKRRRTRTRTGKRR